MDKLIGKVLDNRYEIIEVIGVGGMAVVYKAKCHRLNRFVAIKVLKEEYAADEEFRRRFHEESQSVAMLSHPNIVMELIDGITLKEYLERRGPLGWKETTFFSMQIARALEHAHGRGIIHRDIKPQNIMLLRDGTVKVADFGIARHMTRQQTYNISEAIGSVHYVSPEQAKGSHIDNRADLYSFGVVMYEMLTGRLPFEGDSAVSVALQHINSIPLLPSEHVPGIPKMLENIAMKAMNPVLVTRYSSASQMIKDLEDFRNNPDFVFPTEGILKEDVSGDTQILDVAQLKKSTEAGMVSYQTHADRKTSLKAKDGKGNNSGAQKKKDSNLPTSLIFSLLALIIFFGGAVYFVLSIVNPFDNSDSSKLTVPDLTGLMYDDVTSRDVYSNFIIKEGETVYNDLVSAGKIISQSPLPGRSAGEGDQITVVVSLGPKTTAMSNLVGSEYRSAETSLTRQNIEYIENFDYSDTIEKDMIISTNPAAGAELNHGDKVVLKISLGKKPKDVKVPDLTGMTEEQAREELKTYNLTLGTVTPVDSNLPEKMIIFQMIPAQSEVSEGTAIDVQVSKNGTGTGGTTGGTGGQHYDPVKRSILYTFDLIEAVGLIKVDIRVNGQLQYSGEHYSYEVKLALPLTAYEGANLVQVYQNGELISQQTVIF